jgi:hypothetical protein
MLAEHGDTKNITAVIRGRVMHYLLNEPELIHGPAEQPWPPRHALLKNALLLGDEELRDNMMRGEVTYTRSVGGFTLHAGWDDTGLPCLWLENQMKNQFSLVIRAPASRPRRQPAKHVLAPLPDEDWS